MASYHTKVIVQKSPRWLDSVKKTPWRQDGWKLQSKRYRALLWWLDLVQKFTVVAVSRTKRSQSIQLPSRSYSALPWWLGSGLPPKSYPTLPWWMDTVQKCSVLAGSRVQTTLVAESRSNSPRVASYDLKVTVHYRIGWIRY